MELRRADAPVPYPEALVAMEAQVEAIRAGAPDRLWLIEHPPLYTAGTSANAADLLAPDRFPVFQAGRGGQYTYHGPGQRVGYVMMDLKRRAATPPGPDIRCYVHDLEEWLIRTIAHFGVKAERREGRIGLWVDRGHGREDKIAALGIRVRRWVTFHGVALNVNPDLTHFTGIVPCGISQHGVTSLHDLGVKATMAEVDAVLTKEFSTVFHGKIV
ncbi:MAG: lipoyl(octanoyl) transferase LipB [Rhodospirillaceae bacterium]|nr:lipoyl(octanoyl) transferase LipB [Rhodospirillaceae bacterium]